MDLPSFLTDDSEEQDQIREAVAVAWHPFDFPLTRMQEAYQIAGWWYAKAKDKKRRMKLLGDDPEKMLDAQEAEDLLEAIVKGLDRAVMVQQHLNKHGGSVG